MNSENAAWLGGMLAGFFIAGLACGPLAWAAEPATVDEGEEGPATQPASVRPGGLSRLGPGPPAVEDLDAAELARYVRRIMLRQVRDGVLYEPSYVAPGLRELSCRVAVTLRRDGLAIGAGESELLPVMEATKRAAQAALAAAQSKGALTEAELAGLGLEIELLGPGERIGHAGEDAARLAAAFEPALNGIAIRFDGRDISVRPSQFIAMETFCERFGEPSHRCDRYQIAIENFQARLGLRLVPPQRDPQSVGVYRFRTAHFWQPRPDGPVTRLRAGLRLVGDEEIQPDNLRRIADDLCRYLCYRLNADGTFSYEFLPGRDVYWTREQNWVRQAATTWVLARYARLHGDESSKQAADRAIAALVKMTRPVIGNDRARYLHTPDDLHPMGATALLGLALMDAPQADRHEDLLAAVMAALEGMQQQDGSFKTSFPPCQKVLSQDYYPGEALLAVARYYTRHRDARWRSLCDRALPFYVQYFRQARPPAFIPWQAQAWGELARTTRLQRYADFVYEMTDHLVTLQMEGGPGAVSIYAGGIDTTGSGRGGISSAVYLEGLADAAQTAAVLGDTGRAERYAEASRRAARFVLQLRFKEEEAYYVQSRRDVIGGVRNTPADPTLRIDHCQHALAGLLGVLDLPAPQTQAAP